MYVPAGVKWLRISHPKLGSVKYNFPTAIRKGRTYTMTLTTDKVFTATFDYNHSQKLILHVYPPTATVSVNGNLENITDGTFSKDYYFGTYQYVVSADRYHQFEDTITINSLTRPQERTIRLKQAFGWLQVGNADEMPGARIFIDNKPAGKVTASPLALASGRHSVKVAR